jgi:transposase-like protein
VNDETRQQIADLLHAGASDLDVHRRTGAARTTVARHRKALGLPGYRTTPDSPACRHGHPFPQNLGYDDRGHLVCTACRRAHWREASARAYIPAQPDEAAIHRAAAGDPPERLTPRERAAAIRQLDRQEYSAAVIAERVRCSKRTVHRHRNAA